MMGTLLHRNGFLYCKVFEVHSHQEWRACFLVSRVHHRSKCPYGTSAVLSCAFNLLSVLPEWSYWPVRSRRAGATSKIAARAQRTIRPLARLVSRRGQGRWCNSHRFASGRFACHTRRGPPLLAPLLQCPYCLNGRIGPSGPAVRVLHPR